MSRSRRPPRRRSPSSTWTGRSSGRTPSCRSWSRTRCGTRRPVPLVVLPFVLALYAVRLMADRTAKEALLRVFCRGRPSAEIEAHAGWFLERWVRGRLRGEVVERLASHRAAGLRTILLSASPDLYVPTIGDALGFDEVVCTRVAVGRGRVAGEPRRGQLQGDREGRGDPHAPGSAGGAARIRSPMATRQATCPCCGGSTMGSS